MYYPKSASVFIPFSRTRISSFSGLVLFFANMLLHYHQFMNPNESDLNDVLMPASLSDDKIIKHMARKTLKLFVKMKHRQKLLMKIWWKTGLAPCQTAYTRNLQNARHSWSSLNRDVYHLSDAWKNQRQRNGKRDPDHKCIVFTSLTVLRSFHHFSQLTR